MRVRSKFSRALSAHALSSFRYCLGASEESSEDLLVKLKVHMRRCIVNWWLHQVLCVLTAGERVCEDAECRNGTTLLCQRSL